MSASRSSSTVSKRRTHSRFSFRVRMKRSAQPLPSGSRTKAGELSTPRKRISPWKWWLTYWLPWSWRSRRPAATSLAKAPKRSRTACLTGSSASNRSALRLAGGPTPPAGQGSTPPNNGPRAPPGRAVVARHEHGRLALAGHHRGQVGAPHQVDPVGGDAAVVGLRAVRRAHPLVRQEAVLAREPQDAAAAGADAGEAQPRPQLAVALAVEGAGGQELPDLLDQAIVRHRAERPRSPGGGFARSVPTAVDGRP